MPFEDFDPRADRINYPIAEQSPKLLALAEQLSEDASRTRKALSCIIRWAWQCYCSRCRIDQAAESTIEIGSRILAP